MPFDEVRNVSFETLLEKGQSELETLFGFLAFLDAFTMIELAKDDFRMDFEDPFLKRGLHQSVDFADLREDGKTLEAYSDPVTR